MIFFKPIYYIFINVIYSILSVVSCIVPKKKGLWIFSSWFGKKFSDNPYYFYRYCSDMNDPNLRLIWILKDQHVVKKLNNMGVESYYTYSLKGLYYQLRAEICFFTHSLFSDFFSGFISRTTKRCNFWHGIPLKKIGYDDSMNSGNMKYFQGNLKTKYLYNEWYTYFISSGNLYSRMLSKAFAIDESTIIEVGFPRSEVFLNSKRNDKTIVYMPTFRGNAFEKYDLIEEAKIDLYETNVKLKELGLNLIIRLHPANFFCSKDIDYSNISFDESDGFDEVLSRACFLITDYSSVMFDFYLTGKPIFFFPYDLESYLKKDRSLYFEYSNVIPKESTFNSWLDIFSEDVFSKDFNFNFEFASKFYDRGNIEEPCKKLMELLLK
ncbi:CDP-glycerol glycerophosphotransferase family protein [Vibrio rotiferianus]|uniref:CDP-glycerol glycerophosphotransferase family protein n=1 Tax=Vibrio rotiferianus TaxID=190895 RepID=UPI00390B28ED